MNTEFVNKIEKERPVQLSTLDEVCKASITISLKRIADALERIANERDKKD